MIAVLLLFSIVQGRDVIDDSVDVIEFNHMHAADGSHSFTQVIFWDWDTSVNDYTVIDWRMVKPHYLRKFPRGYRLTWVDGETIRTVRATAYFESWTQTDPEIVDRDKLPQDFRRTLTRFGRP